MSIPDGIPYLHKCPQETDIPEHLNELAGRGIFIQPLYTAGQSFGVRVKFRHSKKIKL
jgi:hypothetical protein